MKTMKTMKTKFLAGAAAAVTTAAASSAAMAGPIADAITGSQTVIDGMATDITTSAAPVYIGAIAAMVGLLVVGGLIKKAFR
ncbi:hypothetical protein ACM64Y_01790 [Novispirillum sp. DQ9]|uniref:hypothetical protein n=1 Tax=Novispirillum sp. DQ9 TaxID=3398612 RepID=UPI003C7C25D3